jgi:hypothetical protein
LLDTAFGSDVTEIKRLEVSATPPETQEGVTLTEQTSEIQIERRTFHRVVIGFAAEFPEFSPLWNYVTSD